MFKAIYLYGISGADQAYRVLYYQFIPLEEFDIMGMKHMASMMKVRMPSIEKVYAISSNRTLKRDYQTAFKKNSIESWAIFKDLLEKMGQEVDC